MSIIVDPKSYILGPAKVYHRAVGVNTPWTSLGPTFEDAVARVNTVWRRPELQGVMGPVMGLDTLLRVDAEVEFTIAEIDGARVGLVIPGSRTTAAVNADSGGGSSSLSAATVAGATSVTVAAVTGFAVADFFRVEAAGNALVEYRQITAVSGSSLSFRDPLIHAHASGAVVVETTGDNRALVEAPVVRRQPDANYKEWALVMESGKSAMHELLLPRAISQTESVEMTIGEDVDTGMRITLGARYLGSDLAVSPFRIYTPAS